MRKQNLKSGIHVKNMRTVFHKRVMCMCMAAVFAMTMTGCGKEKSEKVPELDRKSVV